MSFELALERIQAVYFATGSGKLFHTTGSATEKALSPNLWAEVHTAEADRISASVSAPNVDK